MVLFDVVKDLVRDRYIGGINSYLDRHDQGVFGYARPFIDWILASPLGISIVVLAAVICAVIIHVAFDESRQQKTTLDTSQLTKDDPVVYVSLIFGKGKPLSAGGSIAKDTKVKIECASGKNDALDVQLRFDALRTGQVNFPVIPVIKSGESAEITGTITDQNGKHFASFKIRDIELLLESEWNSYNDLTKETVVVPCSVEYRDAQQNRFRCDASVVYSAWNRGATVSGFQFKRLLNDKPATAKRFPRLTWSAFQFINATYDKHDGIWHERWSQYSSKAFVLHFTNHPYEDGKGEPATLRAQLSWVYENGSLGPSFSPAAWIDEPCGTVEIPVGWSKKLIIGIKNGTAGGYYWDGYSNPRIHREDKHSLDGQTVPYSGTVLVKLIGATDEVWYEQKWKWEEDFQYGNHPRITQL